MKEKLKAYIDLTRAHFAPVWPLLFVSGLMLAFRNGGFFSWELLLLAVFIGLFGFEAGMVLNDIVDHNIDKKDTEDTLTNYWRPFKERPIPSGKISLREAILVFVVLVVITVILILFVPYPNRIYIYIIMAYAYSMEVFYQMVKRKQKFPIAQILGRTDLLLFPIAGYLLYGQFCITIIFYLLFMYPWALAHLGANDIVDIENDQAKELKTIAGLYGVKGNKIWVHSFSAVHLITSVIFVLFDLGTVAIFGFAVSWILIVLANILIARGKEAKDWLKALPMFHASLLIYILSIIIDSALLI
ncbi:MAG: UbiA family prenyltransferase [Candidatus Lokiarchaeota archaeon]|nr:UbiA family prenyltransferase [Candidatus Lokiarchaeota archaeon]